MAISGITTTADNGVERITTVQTVTGTGTVDGETLVLDNSTATLEVTGTGSVVVTNSHVKLDADVNGNNDASCPINYGGRTVTTSEMAFINSIILAGPFTARKNIQVTELTDAEIIEADDSGYMFCYTGTDAIVDNVRFKGINTWEIYAPPSVFFNTIVEDCNYGFLNWEAGRIDVFGFQVINAGIAELWIGAGNSGNNYCYMWNNHSTFDNEDVRHESANNVYYEGYTATWIFEDVLDDSSAVNDVLVVYRENDDGSGQSDIASYVTNSSGYLVGTYDTQFRTTGTSQTRPTLFIRTTYSDTSGTDFQGGAQNQTYDLLTVVPAIEVRSYDHLSPTGFSVSDTFTPTTEIGSIASDLSVNQYQPFGLLTDTGVTVTKTVANAYSGLSDLEQLFDRTKAEWRDNDDYPLPVRDGTIIDFGSTDLVLDGDATSTFTFATDTITVDTSATTASTITLVGSTEAAITGTEDDEISISFPAGIADDDVAYIFVGHAQADENVWNTPSGWTIPTGLTEVQTGGTPASTPGVSVFRRVLSSDSGSVTVTNVGTNTSGIVAQMLVFRGVNTTTPEDVNPVTATGATGDPDPGSITPTNDNSMIVVCGFQDDGDQTSPTQPTGYTAVQDTATLLGAGTGE